MKNILLILLFFIVSMCTIQNRKSDSGKLVLLKEKQQKPALYSNLGSGITVPDGLALDSQDILYMAAPNYLDWEMHGSKIVYFNENHKPIDWYVDLPLHPETGEVHPMGMEFGPDGNLYIADNQYFKDKDCKSRLLRIIIEDGKPVECKVVVRNFKLANAVRWNEDKVYVSDTRFDLPDKKNQSGIYCFSLEEINEKCIELTEPPDDPHLLCTFTAKDFGYDGDTDGADGVCFDKDGNLYCGNFGDGVISRISFNEDGTIKNQEILIDHPSIECCDGIYCDKENNNIYIANSKNNSIHVYNITRNTLQTLWVNADNNGSTGLLDQPCEIIKKDNELIVVNFDMTFPTLKNQENDEYNTLSVFTLE